MDMKPKSLFDFARMEPFKVEVFRAPPEDGSPAPLVLGGATEAANTQAVEQVMAEAKQVMLGGRDFRKLLRALRG
jgi:hypothetical protein